MNVKITTTYDLLCLYSIGFWEGVSGQVKVRIPVWLACRIGGAGVSEIDGFAACRAVQGMYMQCEFLTDRPPVMRRGLQPVTARADLCLVASLVGTWPHLEEAGINTLGECAVRTERELLAIRGVGKQSVAVIKSALAAKGLSFREGGR